jgi:site-specific recombinase XerD
MTAKWISRGTVLIRLGRHHFAFFRGYLDGLDLRQLSERYIEPSLADAAEASDARVAKALVSWIEEQLMVAARRTGTASDARVLRMNVQKLGSVQETAAPDLEEFRDERDPHHMFSEQELLALFEQEYGNRAAGGDRRAKRNKRLRARQIAVLNKLEGLVSADPRLDDGVDGWLDPAIARRLIAVDIRTLNDLVTVIEAYGFRWYTKVPRIGIKAAQYIVEWLLLPETAAALGVSLSIRSVRRRCEISRSMLAALPCRSEIVPLEQFQVPQALSGASGTNRGERSSLGASHDFDAINTWLARRKPGSHTHRAYRKEAERFLLWSVLEASKAISSLTVEDCISYRDFLGSLGRETDEAWAQRFRIRQNRWLGPRGIDRFSSRWRPFEGPLSSSSQKTALVILQSMMQWLADQNYLHNNPFKAMPHIVNRHEGLDVSRALTIAEWQSVKSYLASMTRDDRYNRLRFILALAYSTGCRLSELSLLKRGDMASFVRAGEQDTQWEIIVCGKGDVMRKVQLNRKLVSEIETYFLRRGYDCLTAVPPHAPLIAAASASRVGAEGETPLSSSRIYKLLKSFFEEVAGSVSERDPGLAAKLRRVSTHWLRHTFATHGIHNGIGLETIRDLLGHRSLTTNSIYATTEKDKRSREVEKLENLAEFD